jgi:hypothetical protein
LLGTICSFEGDKILAATISNTNGNGAVFGQDQHLFGWARALGVNRMALIAAGMENVGWKWDKEGLELIKCKNLGYW